MNNLYLIDHKIYYLKNIIQLYLENNNQELFF